VLHQHQNKMICKLVLFIYITAVAILVKDGPIINFALSAFVLLISKANLLLATTKLIIAPSCNNPSLSTPLMSCYLSFFLRLPISLLFSGEIYKICTLDNTEETASKYSKTNFCSLINPYQHKYCIHLLI
jgi:hypothetical protein